MSDLFSIDVGGTFTDLVRLNSGTGEVSFSKVPTTPSRPEDGVLAAIEKADITLPEAETFFHGTTLGINTMLEHKGANTGVITTRGFRDVLEIGRMGWPMYRLHWDKPAPLVERYLRREVSERMRPDGKELIPLSEDEVLAEARYLVDNGVTSIAVCFLHSYAFPDHEDRAGEIIKEAFPDISVTLSHVVTQEYREFERLATTVGDATVKPPLANYLDGLETRLTDGGFKGAFVITRCDGGVMSARQAREQPIRTLVSGPASGVMGGVTLSERLGFKNVICIDMGGTSFDAALIREGEPAIASLTRVEDMPLLVPMIELETIGAGGGSIAWIDAGGALAVGPESAGAEPGPICYGKGGTRPTFTDAALVSGLLAPDKFLGGEIELDTAAAEEGIRTHIAEPLGISVEDAASGIVSLTEAKMAATLEEMTVGKGYDPRDFALLAYGGGGALVADALAAALEVPTVIIPRSPATLSAWGMLTLDVVHDFARTSLGNLAEIETEAVRSRFAALEEQGQEALDGEGVARGDQNLIRSLDMRYEGQEHTLTVEIDEETIKDTDPAKMREVFDTRHQEVYGYSMEDPVEVTAYRLRAVGSLPKPKMSTIESRSGSELSPIGSRTARHRGAGGETAWAIYSRAALFAGDVVEGPAIIEEEAATTLIAPGRTLAVDDLGNMIIANTDSSQ